MPMGQGLMSVSPFCDHIIAGVLGMIRDYRNVFERPDPRYYYRRLRPRPKMAVGGCLAIEGRKGRGVGIHPLTAQRLRARTLGEKN